MKLFVIELLITLNVIERNNVQICSIFYSGVVKREVFKNSCVTTICATPLYMKSYVCRHEEKFQWSQNNIMFLKKFQVIWQPWCGVSKFIKCLLKRLGQIQCVKVLQFVWKSGLFQHTYLGAFTPSPYTFSSQSHSSPSQRSFEQRTDMTFDSTADKQTLLVRWF